MNWVYWLSGLVSLGVFVYLLEQNGLIAGASERDADHELPATETAGAPHSSMATRAGATATANRLSSGRS